MTILTQGQATENIPITFAGKDILGLLGVVLGGILAYLGTKVSSRSQVASKKIESSGPQWQAFVEKMEKQQEDYIKRIKEINELDMQKMEERLSTLESEHNTMKVEMNALMEKYYQAVEVLRGIYEKDKKFFEKMDIPADLWLDIKSTKNN